MFVLLFVCVLMLRVEYMFVGLCLYVYDQRGVWLRLFDLCVCVLCCFCVLFVDDFAGLSYVVPVLCLLGLLFSVVVCVLCVCLLGCCIVAFVVVCV